MSKIKVLWGNAPKAAKWYIGITLAAIIVVVYVCGVHGNNQDNFWNKGEAANEAVLEIVEE